MRLLLCALPLVFACASPLARGRAHFNAAEYPRAKIDFAQAERDYASMSTRERAEFALYRGLTLGALGDLAGRDAWLQLANEIETKRPGTLSPVDRARLKLGVDQSAWEAHVEDSQSEDATAKDEPR
jgi:hypothetical protein